MSGEPAETAPPGAAPGWWAMLRRSADLLATLLSPGTWSAPLGAAVAARICGDTRRLLPRFALLSSLFSIAIVHIVIVTAQSYGLTELAVGAVIRVLSVEILPLAAALFVALQASGAGQTEARRHFGARTWFLAGIASRAFCVVMLASVAGSVALALAYLGVFGFTPWGMASFTRTVGQVFDPIVMMALALKIGLFAAAVATIPAACRRDRDGRPDDEASLEGAVRLFAALIAVETLLLLAEFF